MDSSLSEVQPCTKTIFVWTLLSKFDVSWQIWQNMAPWLLPVVCDAEAPVCIYFSHGLLVCHNVRKECFLPSFHIWLVVPTFSSFVFFFLTGSETPLRNHHMFSHVFYISCSTAVDNMKTAPSITICGRHRIIQYGVWKNYQSWNVAMFSEN